MVAIERFAALAPQFRHCLKKDVFRELRDQMDSLQFDKAAKVLELLTSTEV